MRQGKYRNGGRVVVVIRMCGERAERHAVRECFVCCVMNRNRNRTRGGEIRYLFCVLYGVLFRE